ncbi:hypothetical protein B0J11DRAFT_593877 [Dendryphion nanum]|uniref:Uncharacterized protein n=1 Tax=Dendryphion nanum TaxID=256645 RepID=A0A9P9D9A9_9PLEO|nr:hypothetical protein B0J11DRAFT_593877 [Dendryphion nanum]
MGYPYLYSAMAALSLEDSRYYDNDYGGHAPQNPGQRSDLEMFDPPRWREHFGISEDEDSGDDEPFDFGAHSGSVSGPYEFGPDDNSEDDNSEDDNSEDDNSEDDDSEDNDSEEDKSQDNDYDDNYNNDGYYHDNVENNYYRDHLGDHQYDNNSSHENYEYDEDENYEDGENYGYSESHNYNNDDFKDVSPNSRHETVNQISSIYEKPTCCICFEADVVLRTLNMCGLSTRNV